MSKFIIELQKSCLDYSVKCSELLLKSFFIAKKLDIKELESFCNLELYGYRNAANKLPQYRYVLGEYRIFNPQKNLYEPVCISGKQYGYKQIPLSDSIPELEVFFSSNFTELEITVCSEIQSIFKKEIPNSDLLNITSFFQHPQIARILQSIRTHILNYSIELEKNGIYGDEYMFNNTEQKNVRNISNNIFYGNVSMAGNSIIGQINEGNNKSISKENIEKIINMIYEGIKQSGLSAKEQEKVHEDIENLKQSSKDNDMYKIRLFLKSIKDIFSNVVGNLIASGIIQEISKLLG